MIDTSELTQNITVLAEQQGLSELEVITLLQTGAAASGEEELLDALCYLKRKYIPTVTEQENFYSPTTEHPEKDLPQSPPPTLASNAIAAELRERADSQATPAAREYSNLYDEVSSLMTLAAELVDDHAVMVAEDSNPPTWDYVGDMKHARQLIKQLVAFLSSDGE